jgi:hypothetical protein
MLLTITQAGHAKEQEALASGAPLPKLEKLLIGADAPQAEPHLATSVTAWHEAPILTVEKLSEGALKLTAEVGADVEGHIREIGLAMEDGTLYAYAPYQVEAGGLFKATGFAFSFYVIVSREDVDALNVTYAPLDVDALAQEIADEATARINAQIDATVYELLKFNSQLGDQNLALQAALHANASNMKGQSDV